MHLKPIISFNCNDTDIGLIKSDEYCLFHQPPTEEELASVRPGKFVLVRDFAQQEFYVRIIHRLRNLPGGYLGVIVTNLSKKVPYGFASLVFLHQDHFLSVTGFPLQLDTLTIPDDFRTIPLSDTDEEDPDEFDSELLLEIDTFLQPHSI